MVNSLPLAGYTVLDATHLAAGPWCTMVLADLGANVIKIERPDGGDIARNAGSVYMGDQSAVFLAFNRNKRSLAIDLKHEKGRAAFYRMVSKADVFIENFRPGTTASLGIDYETLTRYKPDLIYASISAFGSSGPYVNKPANDPIIQALSGAMSITGDPDRPPARQGVSVPDFGTGMMAAFAILAALLGRLRTGKGEKLELNLLDVEIFALGPRAQEYLINGEDQPRLGSAHPQFSPYQAFACKGGDYVYIAIINDKFWMNFCNALRRPDWADHPDFRTNSDRVKNRETLVQMIEPILAHKTRDEWIRIFDEHGVPCGAVNTLSEAFSDPQVVHNGIVQTMDHPTLGPVKTLGFPFRLSSTPLAIRKTPPRLGEHSIEVLREFGFAANEVTNLREEGVIYQAE